MVLAKSASLASCTACANKLDGGRENVSPLPDVEASARNFEVVTPARFLGF